MSERAGRTFVGDAQRGFEREARAEDLAEDLAERRFGELARALDLDPIEDLALAHRRVSLRPLVVRAGRADLLREGGAFAQSLEDRVVDLVDGLAGRVELTAMVVHAFILAQVRAPASHAHPVARSGR